MKHTLTAVLYNILAICVYASENEILQWRALLAYKAGSAQQLYSSSFVAHQMKRDLAAAAAASRH
jgi:hypothetical protein